MRRRRELTDHEALSDRDIAAQQASWSALRQWPARAGRHFPEVPHRVALDGNPRAPWPSNTLLQPLCPLAQSRRPGRLPDEISKGDGDIVMIDSTCVRVQQHGATRKKGMQTMSGMGRSRDGLASKVDAQGRPAVLRLTAAQVCGSLEAKALLEGALGEGVTLLAGKGCDGNAVREKAKERKAWANGPSKSNRKASFAFSAWVYRQRNLVERVFNRIKQFRGIATRYDKIPDNFLPAVKRVALRL